MNIEDIKAFIMVAELRSISGAATKLHHIQSNMSAKIKKIESYYGHELFKRSSKGVVLTPQGETLYGQFKKIVVDWEETELKMRTKNNDLRIGTMTSIGGSLFSNSLKQLHKENTGLSFHLKTGSTEEIEQEVLLGNIDIAYTIGSTPNLSNNIYQTKIGHEELYMIGKGIHPFSSLNILNNQKILILSKKCLYVSIIEDLYNDLGFEPGEFIEINDLGTLIHLSLDGMGVSLISKRTIEKFKVKSYVKLPFSHRFIDLYRIQRKNYRLTSLEKRFIQLSVV